MNCKYSQQTAIFRVYEKRKTLIQFKTISKALYDEGVKIILLKRANGKAMPFAELIEVGEHETTWKIDLNILMKRIKL